MVTNFRIFYDNNPGDLFPRIGGTRSFALRAQFHADLDDGDGDTVLSIEILDTLGAEIVSEDPGDAAARDDTLLALLVKPGAAAPLAAASAPGSDGGVVMFTVTPPPPVTGGPFLPPVDDASGIPWVEVCSCVEFAAVSAGVLAVTVLRARQGTPARQFVAGDEVWFVRRDQLALVAHEDFAGLAANLDPGYFKLQPVAAGRARPLEDCAPRPFTFGLTPYVIPPGTFGSLALDPPMGNFSGTMPVRVAAAGWQEVHYTIDGSEVTVESPKWPVEEGIWGINADPPRAPLVIDRSCRLRVRGWERKPVARATGRFTGLSTPEAEGYYTSGATTVPPPVMAFSPDQVTNNLYCSLACADPAATFHYRVMGYVKAGWQWTFKTDAGDVVITSSGSILATGWFTLPAGYSGEAFHSRGRWWFRVMAYATRPGFTDSIITDDYYNYFGGPKTPPAWPA
jgi:hypothetical protein